MAKIKKTGKKTKVDQVADTRNLRSKTVSTTIDISAKVINRIDELAEEDMRTRSNFVSYIILRYVKMREKKTPGISNT